MSLFVYQGWWPESYLMPDAEYGHEVCLIQKDREDDWLAIDSSIWECWDLRKALNVYLRWVTPESAMRREPPPNFNLVLWDEAHQVFLDKVNASRVLRDIVRGHRGQLSLFD